MNDAELPHPSNAPGPFYVVNGCCTSCDVPVSIAPDLFAYDSENHHCYVRRQPATKDELNQVMRAVWAAEFECLRYRGSAPEVLRRLAEAELARLCDEPPFGEVKPVFRNHATFEPVAAADARLTALDLAEMFKTHLLSRDRKPPFEYRFTKTRGGSALAWLSYSWVRSSFFGVHGQDNDHSLEFLILGASARRWLIRHSPIEKPGARGISLQLDDWLKGVGLFQHVRWYSHEEWATAVEGEEFPQ